MARQACRNWSASSRRILLSAVRCFSSFTPASPKRTAPGKPETFRGAAAAPDSRDRSDPCSPISSSDPDAVSLSHQTPVLVLHRAGTKNLHSGEYRIVGSQLKRSKKALAIRGLNRNHNHDLKNVFKGAATLAAATPGPFQNFYEACLERGVKASMARLTLARKIASITLVVWKKGVRFDAEHLKQQAA